MRPIWKRTSRALSLLIACAVMQVYVLAAPAAGTPVEATHDAPLFGRLLIAGAEKAFVNGNEAPPGTTVLSGAQIETPGATGATVSLASAGRLDVAPNTNLTLTFDRGSVSVVVLTGEALLTTAAGVRGSLTMPDGKTKVADGAVVSSVGTAMYGGGAGEPQNPNSNACFIAGMPCALFWVMVGGGAAVATYFAATRGRGRNPSPGVPRGP